MDGDDGSGDEGLVIADCCVIAVKLSDSCCDIEVAESSGRLGACVRSALDEDDDDKVDDDDDGGSSDCDDD